MPVTLLHAPCPNSCSNKKNALFAVDAGACHAHQSTDVNTKTCFKQQRKKRKVSTEVTARSVRQRSLLNRLQRQSANVIAEYAQQPDFHANQGTLQCLFASA